MHTSKKLAIILALPFFCFFNQTSVAKTAENFGEMFTKGDIAIDLRYRIEHVDQVGNFDDTALASTLRTKLSFKSAVLSGFQFFVEGENNLAIGNDRYNSTVNSKGEYPIIADPQSTELNQAWLGFKSEKFAIQGGRQGINLGTQRFVGTVGWRQNDQTYDSVTTSVTPIEKLSVTYGYIWNVNRIFSHKHPLGDLKTDTHVVYAIYSGLPYLKVAVHALLIDLDNPAVFGLSSSTYGLRLSGDAALSDQLKLSYAAAYSRQSDYGNNPNDYAANYWAASAGVSFAGFKLEAGFELLGSDGGTSFQTPLATLHKFNGFADKFLGTPANGLEDIYVSAAYTLPGDIPVLGKTVIKVIYHDFSSDIGGLNYGREVDWLIKKTFDKKYTVLIKGAHYTSKGFAANTDKIWFQVSAKF